MRNYVIINGVSSLTIPGLAIRELPAISKTLMRNQKEEIDGRDGDIITELGYSAYDKTMTIGLYGSYDINQIIAFFNQKGTIVFSDEADKYYNFTILEKIDYDKLVKFRTASVRIHCQPFKYPVSETPVEIEAEYVTATGEDITLNNTGVAPLEIGLKGDTYQYSTTGKQLFNKELTPTSTSNATISQLDTGIRLTLSSTSGNAKIKLGGNEILGKTITIKTTMSASSSNTTTMYLAYVNDSGTNILSVGATRLDATGITTYTIRNEMPENATQLDVVFTSEGASSNYVNYTDFMIVEGTYTSETFPNYEPYTGGTPAPNPDYPYPVNVVTGDNEVKVEGKNLINVSDISDNLNNQYYKNHKTGFTLEEGVTYTLSFDAQVSVTPFILTVGTGEEGYVRDMYTEGGKQNGRVSITFTPTSANLENATKLFIRCPRYNSATTTTFTLKNFQLEKSSTATTYEEHKEQTYPINLGSMELCKIGDYQDYLYKENGIWCKYGAIGKVVLDGSENWVQSSSMTTSEYFGAYTTDYHWGTGGTFANKNNFIINNFLTNDNVSGDYQFISSSGYACYLKILNTIVNSVQDLKTWLSNNNAIVYYVLATPTITEITDTTLIEQLDNLEKAYSYDTQTNISQTNQDKPFIISYEAILSLKNVLNS